jgi:hypothetical protein
LATRPADAIVVARLDRLSRSVHDFSGMVEKSLREDWSIILLEPEIDFSTPEGRLFGSMLSSFAAFERDLISQRISEALQAKKARGDKLGPPVRVTTAQAIYMVDLRNKGLTYRQIALYLTFESQWTPPDGGDLWQASTVAAVIKRWLRPIPVSEMTFTPLEPKDDGRGPVLPVSFSENPETEKRSGKASGAWSGSNAGFSS